MAAHRANAANDEAHTFEIGLVMAGAVSAGAYTAGVLDFLFETMTAYEGMRDPTGQDPARPHHKVVIRVMAGASAGGICSALAMTQLLARTKDGTLPEGFDPNRSVLYNTWVRGIDISHLLDTKDLSDKSKPVESALDCTRLDVLTDLALDRDPVPAEMYPPFLSDPMDVYLSVANTRGVPYGIRAGGGTERYGHEMTMHADHLHFQLVNEEAAPYWVEDSDSRLLARGALGKTDAAWRAMGDGALATSAFPIGLKARTITRSTNDYDLWRWPVPLEGAPCQGDRAIPPNWDGLDRKPLKDNYAAVCVDGGMMNNEPFELARRRLAGLSGRNPREPDEARRAVIIIDPFPDMSAARKQAYDGQTAILSIFGPILRSLINQARFKPDELSLASDGTTFSRFLISPKRVEDNGAVIQPPIQSAALGGFGGFFHQAFREHDYELGRRNCERFLKEWFYLSPDNPIFGGWTGGNDQRERRGPADGMDSLPILPISNPKQNRVPLPPRQEPATVIDRAELDSRIKDRLKPFGKRLLAHSIDGFFGWALRRAWGWALHKTVRKKIMRAIDEAFGLN